MHSFYFFNAHKPLVFIILVFVSHSQTSTSTGLSKGVSAQCLFDLLVSLEGETQDALDALELVKAEKPLRSLGNFPDQYQDQITPLWMLCMCLSFAFLLQISVTVTRT